MRIALLVVISITLVSACFSQSRRTKNIPSYYGIESHLAVGRIVKNHPKLPKNSGLTYFESLTFNIRTNKKIWNRLYKAPNLGFTLGSTQFNNNSVYGNTLYGIAQLKFHVGAIYPYGVNFSFGSGLSYNSAKFELLKNEQNIAISSDLNNVSKAEIGYSYTLGRYGIINATIGVLHFSNGKVSVPNVGINAPYLGLSYTRYTLQFRASNTQSSDDIIKKDRIKINARFGLGFTKSRLAIGPRQYVYSGQLFASKKITATNNVQAGFEAFFHKGVYNFIIHQQLGESKMDATRLAFFAGHEFLIGHFSLLTQGGIYFDKSQLRSSLFSTRLGFNYYLKNLHTAKVGSINPYLGLAVKSDFGEADFVEVSFGVPF